MIRHLIAQELCEILMCSLVLSHLDYGNGCPFGISDYSGKKDAKDSEFCD